VRPRPVLLVLGLALGGLGLLGAWAPLRDGLLGLGQLLAAGDLATIREHLRSFGPWAPVVAFALIQLQAVLAPLPSFPVIYANGLLFGTLWGGLLSWISVLVSAALCFGLARRWGRPLVERVVSPAALRTADALFDRYGVFAVLLGRLLPLTAFDLLSYAAGLTPMRVRPFLTATAIGMTPTTFLMAAAGDLGTTSWRTLGVLLLGFAGLAALAAWLRPPRGAPAALRALSPSPKRDAGSAAPEVLRKALAQEQARPVDARLHGGQADAEQLGDLGVRQPLHVVERKGGPVVGR
jgi:uncharacterized membrane protein YdjX (TVP38/TMEM64 family)